MKRKFPIVGKPFMSFLEDLVARGFAAQPWRGEWQGCLSSHLISEQTPITLIRDWNCRFWSHRGCPGEKTIFFATCVYLRVVRKNGHVNRRFKWHYSVLFSLHGRRKRGKKQVERNSHELPLLAFSLPYRHLPRSKASEDSSPSRVFALHACFAF